MSQQPMHGVVAYLRRVLSPPGDGVPDAELLERFVRARDEAAFELLVWRHGKAVLATCRRVLRDAHEAEDAFQATFLLLARRAGSIGRRAAVGGWLRKVAYRVALEARSRRVRRQAHEQARAGRSAGVSADDPVDEAIGRELRRVIDEEVGRLVEKYRTPFVLCYYEGKSNAEAARALGCPVGTVESRLTRARARLRARLARRGVSAALLADGVGRGTAWAAVPDGLVGATARAAARYAAGRPAAGLVSVEAATLAEGVLRTMILSKLTVVTAVALAVGVAGVAAGVLAAPARMPWSADEGGAAQVSPPGAKAGTPKGTVESAVVKKVDAAGHTITVVPQSTARFSEVLFLNERVHEAKLFRNSKDPKSGQAIFQEVTVEAREARRKLSPQVKVLIDGKEAKPADLTGNVSVQLTEENGVVTRIEATGDSLEGVLDGIDPAKGTITLGRPNQHGKYELAKDATVEIDGKPHALADLKPEMPATLRFSARRPAVIGIRAEGPKVECVLKAVDPDRRTVTVRLRSAPLTVPDLPVADGAEVRVGGRAGRLADLKAGMRITLRLAADPESNLVVGMLKD
jgi:RNA polymerase sigma factor (sigma-70 family)